MSVQIIFSSVRIMLHVSGIFVVLVISLFGFEDKISVLFESALGHCLVFCLSQLLVTA